MASSDDEVRQVPGNMDDVDENTIKILVATDCHVGYMEKDSIRHSDSINTFEEILQLARKNKVDMVLLGGDLFHENKPSRKSLHGVMTLLRKYCMGDRPVQIEFLSDQSVNFAASPFPSVNYEDANLNIDMPVFSIHGNHDDPAGLGNLCALDMLSVSGLVNYFGKSTSLESVEISPILIQKGTTKLATFGLGSIRDERLHRMFLSGKISMLRPKQNADSWFNIFVIHQNRAKHGEHNYIPEQFLDNFIDLVIWGHEHECLIDPVWNATQNFFISQPGSSIATSLSPGEAEPKHVGLLQVRGKAMKCTKLKLETVRPFYIEDIALQDTTLNPDDVKLAEKTSAFCTEKVEALIQRAEDEHTGNRKQPTLPLIRLRVDYSGGFDTINVNRFGQKFVGRVANTKDLVRFTKRRIQLKKEDTKPGEDLGEFLKPEALETERVEDLVRKYFSETEETKQLELLSEKGLGQAVREYVDKEEKEAIQALVKHQLSQTQGQLKNRKTTEEHIDDELHRFKVERREMTEADVTQEVKVAITEDRSQRPDAYSQDYGVDSDEESIGGGNGDGPSRSTRGRARGRGAAGSTARGIDDDDEMEVSMPASRGSRAPKTT
eukprot:XP_011677726.1 PREDICTED: double-strand break repair protein MRE11A [Strongylocentrotus purpuratus]